MSAKRNVLKSQLPLIVIAATVCLLALMWLVYRSLGRSRCDSIFEQTADRVQANLEFIKIKGELALGSQKGQELTDSSQKVGIHLKLCCHAQETRRLNADQFQVCMSGAKELHKLKSSRSRRTLKKQTQPRSSRNRSLQNRKPRQPKKPRRRS